MLKFGHAHSQLKPQHINSPGLGCSHQALSISDLHWSGCACPGLAKHTKHALRITAVAALSSSAAHTLDSLLPVCQSACMVQRSSSRVDHGGRSASALLHGSEATGFVGQLCCTPRPTAAEGCLDAGLPGNCTGRASCPHRWGSHCPASPWPTQWLATHGLRRRGRLCTAPDLARGAAGDVRGTAVVEGWMPLRSHPRSPFRQRGLPCTPKVYKKFVPLWHSMLQTRGIVHRLTLPSVDTGLSCALWAA